MQLLFGTQNPNKQLEAQEILRDVPVELVFPQDIGGLAAIDPAETGDTFHDNALIKARAFAEASQLATIADDTGLEISALDGAPGVNSKRFVPGSDADRIEHVLQLLQDKHDRSAQFTTIICLYDSTQDEEVYFRGVVKGRIAEQAAGSAGFGYDPIFIPDGYEQTFGELGQDIKNTLSHRARALEHLKNYLLNAEE